MVLSKNINFQCWKITKKQQKEKKDKKKIKFKKRRGEDAKWGKNKIILYSFFPAFLFIKYFEILIGSKNIL